MSISFHIYFNGQCQEAFEYYAEHLGGNIGLMLEYKDSPASSSVPANWQHKIVHGNVSLEGVELAGADVVPEQYHQPRGFYLLLGASTEDKVNAAFEKLAVGGNVILPPQKTFWSPCYAIVIDQYAVPWKINCGAR
ncbi:VOC family protein [Marinimicrobium sp. ABcell2]|uniref:VOC family protein n=1 Tax=Marinimicrobium sp. ABcell2 TaxID=3069751 RepID=UPI0027B5E17A|nr:VOC family protein [Marinimicrobium sp. ABcell2]MDQ2077974.1 VOC family protein [Marinimicrobium sp. ABcell2]